MTISKKIIQAAAGNAGEAVYVDDLFSTYLYEGNNSGGSTPTQTITNGIDLSGEGGLVWLKGRSNAAGHNLIDTERGIGKYLSSEGSGAEGTPNSGFGLTAFNSDGFTLGGTWNTENFNGYTYASWTFRKQPGFFDVVTYTGDGTSNRAIPHNVGAEVGMMIVKRLDSTQDWHVYHRSLDSVKPADYRLLLNENNARLSGNSAFGTGDGTPPTTTEFTVHGNLNLNSATYVCYLFAHNAQDFGENSDEAIIKCGGYTGSSTLPYTVDVGFEPQWLMIKRYDSGSADDWMVVDMMRGQARDDLHILEPNNTNAENATTWKCVPVANGFQVDTNVGQFNGNGAPYIYVAIRRPQKPASEFAATDLFAIDTRGGTSPTPPAYVSGFPVDMAVHKNVSSTGDWRIQSRLTSGEYLTTNDQDAPVEDSNMAAFDFQNGYRDATGSSSNSYAWMWRRAKGYFDAVTYVGTGSNRTISHGLGVTPEMIWVMPQSFGGNKRVWLNAVPKGAYSESGTSATVAYRLNHTDTGAIDATFWNSTDPTASVFSLGTNSQVNSNNEDYVAYLFATVPGISKLGTISVSSGSDITVDCGFSNGARFVMLHHIGRSDSSSDFAFANWYVFDSDRGIASGNDPYVIFNGTSTSAVGAMDAIDPHSSGFILKGNDTHSQSSISETGGVYFFYAIA